MGEDIENIGNTPRRSRDKVLLSKIKERHVKPSKKPGYPMQTKY